MPTPDAPDAARFTWDYQSTSRDLRRLYDQATTGAWSIEDLDWRQPVDVATSVPALFGDSFKSSRLRAVLGRERSEEFLWHVQAWMLSQLLHGEQGGLLVAGRLVEVLPDLDQKLCAAAQTLDEARHVDVLSRYLHEKVQVVYPPSDPLQSIMEDIVGEAEWDKVFIAMQLVVEGVALGTFGASRFVFTEPLAQAIIQRIMGDEARHVAFGMSALTGALDEMADREREERYDLVKSALSAMRSRFDLADVHERFGLSADDAAGVVRSSFMAAYRKRCFSRVPPLLRRVGIWDAEIAGLLDRPGDMAATGH